jgi:hypothetical protein
MKTLCLFAILGLLAAPTALAQSSDAQIIEKPSAVQAAPQDIDAKERRTSEFFFQASPHENLISLIPTYTQSNRVTNQSSNDQTYTQTAQIILEHGFSNLLSMRLSTSYGTSTDNYSDLSYPYSFQGFSDIVLSANGFFPFNSFHLVYELKASFSPAANEWANFGVTGNRFSGGETITPKLGFEIPVLANLRVGPYVEYEFNGNEEFEEKNPSGEILNSGVESGGNEFIIGGFAEYVRNHFKGGVYAQFENFESSTQTSADDSIAFFDARLYADMGVYGLFNVTDSLVVKPALGYQVLMNQSYDGSDSYSHNYLNASVTLRMTL